MDTIVKYRITVLALLLMLAYSLSLHQNVITRQPEPKVIIQKADCVCPVCTSTTCSTQPQVTCPTVTTLEVTTTTATTTTLNDIYLSDNEKHKLLNMRWSAPTSECAQYGYKACRADYLSELGLKNKYNDQVIYETAGMTIKGSYNISQDSYCFLKQTGSTYGMHGIFHSYGFFLNSSLWNWTNTNTSWVVETPINWTDADNLTWIKYNITVQSNMSDNLWVESIR
jgi:hypothetical protein